MEYLDIVDKNELALQLRSKKVSFCPLHWSTPVGGHVQSNENFEEAALREFEEELGLKTKIDFLRKDFYSDSRGNKKFLVTFKTIFNGPFKPDKEVVEKVEFFSTDEIKKMIIHKEKFHPELLFLLKRHFKI